MTIAQSPPTLSLPDHTQLPESDGTFVFAKRAGGSQNFQEHPQSILLTSSIRPVLEQLHPDGRYCIGEERADVEKQRAELEKQRADVEKQRADRLAAKLREMGVDPQDI